jgi:3-oxoacyl-[acyl-carrier protein] reductase
VVKAAIDEFGRLDILVNNAGMNWDGVSWKMSEEQWDRVLEVNLKGYFNLFTKALAKELGGFGVNVNAVAPGLIETAMLKESEARDKIIDLAMGESALKQVGQPEDLGYLVAFLASEKARHITGEVIKIDGGQYI